MFLCPKHINIYKFLGGLRGGCTWSTVHFLFIIPKNRESIQEHDIYLNQILHHFNLTHFSLGWIIKKLWKWGPRGPMPFLYEVSTVILIDFIAILLTPGIFLTQIVTTNMYLIHFHSKNIIKMHFPKSWVFKVSKPLQPLNFYLGRRRKRPFYLELYALQRCRAQFSK